MTLPRRRTSAPPASDASAKGKSTPPVSPRDAVLHAATRRFAGAGFDGTAIQDIANDVGVTKQAILHHFPSKELLREAVLDGIVGHWYNALPRLLLVAAESDDRVDAVLGALVGFFTEDGDRARLLFREALDRPDEMRRLVAGPARPFLFLVAGYIQAGQASPGGEPRFATDADAEAYVLHVLALVLTHAALGPVVDAALSAPPDERAALREKELFRIAKRALFYRV